MKSEFTLLIPKLLSLAHDAGVEILKIYSAYLDGNYHSIGIVKKNDSSPLTAADLIAHSLITSRLQELTPLVPVVSEEDYTNRTLKMVSGEFWLIDPLDGTKDFVAQNGDFTVNIAFIKDGFPLWGCVYAPVIDELYFGGMEFGSCLMSKGRISVINVSKLPKRGELWRVVASKSHLNQATKSFIDSLGKFCLVQAGSSLKMCRVAEGAADIYPRLAPTCEWDTAAAQAIVEGAGGTVHDLEGNRLNYAKDDVLNPSFLVSSEIFLGYK